MNDSQQLMQLKQLKNDLLSDLLLFTQVFFEKKNAREFIISKPISNQSHFIEIINTLSDVFLLKVPRLIINCPPGWAKSELCKAFIAWGLAHYPDARSLYISYSHELASAHTHSIKQTIMLPTYKTLFDVEILRDSSAKDFFQTNHGGAVAAFGSGGAITGRDAGLPGLERYSGCIIIDDIHKPDEVHSDSIREKVKRNYFETIETRLRGKNVPVIIIGQRLHEDDLFSHLLAGADGQKWKSVVIKGLDDAGNARYPEVMPKERLLTMKEKQPYVFSSQYQQNPIPAGGALFKEEWIPILEERPDIFATFVTADTAETDKEYNDKTVFSFWGVYQIKFNNIAVDKLYALHWLNCWELNIEPKDIEPTFLDFWATCMRDAIKPKIAIIEKKSTGVTLLSSTKNIPGLKTVAIDRTSKSGSKSARFVSMQPFIAGKQVSLPSMAKHTKICIEHMSKITANNTHRFDDIADTCYDAVKAALIDKIFIPEDESNYNDIARSMNIANKNINLLRNKAFGQGR
jgi:predicted phage terminase large subunit-like protein